MKFGSMSAGMIEYRLVIGRYRISFSNELMEDEYGTLDNRDYGAVWLLWYIVVDCN